MRVRAERRLASFGFVRTERVRADLRVPIVFRRVDFDPRFPGGAHGAKRGSALRQGGEGVRVVRANVTPVGGGRGERVAEQRRAFAGELRGADERAVAFGGRNMRPEVDDRVAGETRAHRPRNGHLGVDQEREIGRIPDAAVHQPRRDEQIREQHRRFAIKQVAARMQREEVARLGEAGPTAKAGAACERSFDFFRSVARDEHDVVDPRASQQVELALRDRATADRQQAFGDGLRERAEPRRQARGKDDGSHAGL